MASNINAEKIEINQLIRSNRRTVGLQITQDASLIVRAPKTASLKFITSVILEKRAWIIEKQRLAKERPNVGEKQFAAGEIFYFLGADCPLLITETEQKFYQDGNFYLQQKQLAYADEIFHDWYRQQAQQIISERVAYFAQNTDRPYKKIRISDTRAQWASCSAEGVLSFCWRLILAPLPAVDYVVAHELAHLTWRGHSQRFWHKVKMIYPEYEAPRKWLSKNSHLLNFL